MITLSTGPVYMIIKPRMTFTYDYFSTHEFHRLVTIEKRW